MVHTGKNISRNTVGVSTGHGQPSHMGIMRGHTDKLNEYQPAVTRDNAAGISRLMADKQQE